MLSPSKPHNHVVPLTGASAKPAILLSAPKFDTGANTFFIVFLGGEKALFTRHRPASVFFPPRLADAALFFFLYFLPQRIRGYNF